MHPPAATPLEVSAPDPRDVITPDAFQVQAALYGLPLAAPWRRLAAVAVDGLAVALIAQAGGLLLAVAVAVVFFGWWRGRQRGGSVVSRGLRAAVGLLGAMVLFAAALSVLPPLWQRLTTDGSEVRVPGTLQGREAVAAGVAIAALHACDDAACRAERLGALSGVLAETTLAVDERRDILDELADAVAADATEAAALKASVAAPPGIDGADDAGGVPPVSLPAAPVPAAPVPAVTFSILALLRQFADDIGFSVGWGAVYFTLLTVLWDGQTLGKRWFGIRVISLRGVPIGYWDAFERYGGYAAGLATGLLGFLQVYWDPNRQAIHDRICFTAVIRDADGRARQRMRARQPEGAERMD